MVRHLLRGGHAGVPPKSNKKTASSRSRIAAFRASSSSHRRISVQLSVDVGAFVAGRLLGGVEAGDDVDHTAGGGHGVIAEAL